MNPPCVSSLLSAMVMTGASRSYCKNETIRKLLNLLTLRQEWHDELSTIDELSSHQGAYPQRRWDAPLRRGRSRSMEGYVGRHARGVHGSGGLPATARLGRVRLTLVSFEPMGGHSQGCDCRCERWSKTQSRTRPTSANGENTRADTMLTSLSPSGVRGLSYRILAYGTRRRLEVVVLK